MSQTAAYPQVQRSPWPVLLLGGLVVGTFDILFAISFWRIGYGTAPSRIFQSIAAGLLGQASYEGGAATAWLGAVLHYFIASVIVLVYYLASLRIPKLVERPIPYGLLYGIGVYIVMNYVVIPLSATQSGRFNLAWVASSIVVHAVLIGLPAAIFARRAHTAAMQVAP